MKSIMLAIAALTVLAACKPTEEEKQKLEKALPPGCVAHDIGKYGSINQLVIIECSGRNVTAAYSSDSRTTGKTTTKYQAAVFVIEGK
jgi:hypothetical protein